MSRRAEEVVTLANRVNQVGGKLGDKVRLRDLTLAGGAYLRYFGQDYPYPDWLSLLGELSQRDRNLLEDSLYAARRSQFMNLGELREASSTGLIDYRAIGLYSRILLSQGFRAKPPA